ncbi:hypothetical protein EBS80_01585 [bacterium]|nr:hypothetical protein [bacterium]
MAPDGGGFILQNAGWYNQSGEFIGWGDLAVSNLVRIAAEIENGEEFLIVEESVWRGSVRLEDQDLAFAKAGLVFRITSGKIEFVDPGGCRWETYLRILWERKAAFGVINRDEL